MLRILAADKQPDSPRQFEFEQNVDFPGLRVGKCIGTRKFAVKLGGLVFDFSLGTHPISRKGTTELGRSEATKRF